MSWWERYRAWEPERYWDRYQAWRFESRTRWVVTAVGVRVLLAFFLLLFTGSSAESALRATAIFAVLVTVLCWFLYYPLTKRSRRRVGSAPMSPVHHQERG